MTDAHAARPDAEVAEQHPDPPAARRWEAARDRLRRVSRRMTAVPQLFLGITLLCTIAPVTLQPQSALDPSWVLALNLAHERGLQYGPQIVYTYGPWGFLDNPLAVSKFNILAAMLFTAIAVVVAWNAIFRVAAERALAGSRWSAVAAAIFASAVVIYTLPVGGASLLLLFGLAIEAIRFVNTRDRSVRPWVPAACGAAAALLIQIKVSEGSVLVGVALVAAIFAPERRLRRFAETVVALVVATVALWLLAGQHLGNLIGWLRSALDISHGYADAMSVELQPNRLGYLLIFAALIATACFVVANWRRHGLRQGLGVALLVAGVCFLGFREATTRHEEPREAFFFLLVLGPAIYFVRRVGPTRLAAAFVVLLVVLASDGGVYTDTQVLRDRLGLAAEVVTSSAYQREYLKTARSEMKQFYGLKKAVRSKVGDHPVNVDGFDSALPWAYKFNWRPMPAFQSYVAYTPKLDKINADWLVDSPPSQRIIRPLVTAIDGRNPLWDPPQYMVAEFCNTRVESAADSRWLLLQKTSNRCSTQTQLVAARHVSAHQSVDVPTAGSNQLVTMSFQPDPPGLLSRLLRTLNKPRAPLQARVNGNGLSFRLPRALAPEQLAMTVPRNLDWPAQFGGGTSYRSVAFSEPGTISFQVRDLAS